jgi:hypothetical protein
VVCLSTPLRGSADVVLAFVRTRREVQAKAKAWKRGLAAGGSLWICYPKLTSASAGELSRDVLWRDLEPLGLRPVAMVAIDPTWSAMRFKVVG